ncbi:hypothetical protein QTO30_10685 [Yoonia sp. GPGPB17]
MTQFERIATPIAPHLDFKSRQLGDGSGDPTALFFSGVKERTDK